MTARAIAAGLKQEIFAGALRPGADLRQAEIAERFGVSRIPVRDALGLLASEGLVVVTPNRGARVVQFTAEEVREIYDLRILLECDCLARAIEAMGPQDDARLEAALRRSNVDAETDAFSDGDWDFHRALYAPAGRLRQIGLIRDLRVACRTHISAYAGLPGETPRWLADHADIVELSKARRTVAAVDALRAHLSNAGDTLLGSMAAL